MQLWVTEEDNQGIRTSFAIDSVLFRAQSEFQTIEVVQSKPYGRMLLLDGLVMITERDEFVYHEMISHIPVCLHRNPRHVVVVGGGDGGTVRELLKHDVIESVMLCEIDGMVIDCCKSYFPELASSLKDPRVQVRVGDGVSYIAENRERIDLVIVDSSDPIGPGVGLFSADFYKNVAAALRPGGVMAAQTESPWHAPDVLKTIFCNMNSAFSNVLPYVGSIPTYPKGFWSWGLASNEPVDPARFDRARFDKVKGSLGYLNDAVFLGAFALPNFFGRLVSSKGT